MRLQRKQPYKYVRYDRDDEAYFGCVKVVRAEWDYIYKRRANQAATEQEEPASSEERLVNIVVPESDGRGGFWVNVIQVLTRVKRKKPRGTETRQENESKHARQPAPPNLTGIALSGGGIRSASFCLGILQALSFGGWLKNLDYMSTVSGGGYIGGSLSWLLHRKWKGEHGEDIPYGLDRRNFPYGTYPMAGMEAKSETGKTSDWDVYKGRMLRHLRQHAHYLTPGDGINFMSLVAVTARNALFSLFVYGGLLALLFALARPYLFGPVAGVWVFDWMIWRFDWFPINANFAQGMAIFLALTLLALAILYVIVTALLLMLMGTGYRLRYFYERWMGRMLTAVLILGVIGVVPVVYCWLDEAGRGKPETTTIDAISLAGQVGNLGEVSLAGEIKHSIGHPLADSAFEVASKNETTGDVKVDGNITATGKIETSHELGWSLSNLKENLAELVGIVSTLFGVLSTALVFAYEGKKKKRRKIPTSVFVAIASFGLIFGLLLLSYHFSLMLRSEAVNSGAWKPGAYFSYEAFANNGLLLGLGVLLLFFLRFPNLNYLSLHRYYRDRLMETFTPDLPDAISVNGPVPGANKSADYTDLYQMLNEQAGPGEMGPYHIINTNIVLVSSQIPKFRGRGGDNFILTAKFCGSNATGWCETRHSPYDDMTIPTALAISGAAVNSNAGSGGSGITRTPWLSFLMGFFNMRLGYWADNPTPQRQRLDRIAKELKRRLETLPDRNEEEVRTYSLRVMWHGVYVLWRWPLNQLNLFIQKTFTLPWCAGPNRPNAFFPGLLEIIFRKNHDENSRMVQLSDGGHFENLGLYELIRRRLKLIIVCDGSADPTYGFDDLANAVEKVRVDFGAMISFDCGDLESLTPKSVVETGDETGNRVTYAERGFLIGEITYNDESKGTLIYLPTTLFRDMPADIYGYRKAHQEFPDESTSDQFFDEKQFEAYRELGFQTAYKMMCDEKVRAHDEIIGTLGTPQFKCADGQQPLNI